MYLYDTTYPKDRVPHYLRHLMSKLSSPVMAPTGKSLALLERRPYLATLS